MNLNTTTTNANLSSSRQRVARRVVAAAPAALPRGLFVAEVLTLGLPHIGQDSFRGVVGGAELDALGQAVLVRADPDGDEVEALLRLPTGQLALIDGGYGDVRVEVAATTRVAAELALAELREAFAATPAPTRLSVAFWMAGRSGGHVRHREVDAPTFASIVDNYSASVSEALARLVEMREPEGGRLILWRGEPGTGKSHALRALAREWAPWCSAHFIMDPNELFGRGGAYILDVLAWQGADEDRWRLLILEDAGELIAADARAASGQALSRLLNVADGLLGQGTRTLVLITTNEPVKQLHPATRRPGRCLADIEFAPLSVIEANAWLAARGLTRRVGLPTPVAELYASESESAIVRDNDSTKTGVSFGFARALGEVQSD